MENKRALGKYISELRISRGLAKIELAEKIGVSENTVDRWESGKSLPDLSLAEKLAGVLNVSVSDLLESTEHAPLPEKAEDLTYQQQADRQGNRRFSLVTLLLLTAYVILCLLATRTDILASMFPAMIALTITIMIFGLYNLIKAIYGSLYARIEPHRYLLAGFCLLVVPLSFFDWMHYQIQRESAGKTNVEVNIETVESYVDLDLSGCQVKFSYENTGWFGNGTRVYYFEDPQGLLAAQIETGENWQVLPADEQFIRLVSENITYGEMTGLPEVSRGYYYIACNTAEEVIYIADPEAGIRDFVAAIYDSEKRILYIARYVS
ncbi:MAG: helix-turn-helix domain-containing protein [Erysipelotrichaceae bacterium]|nr:helix-turn-helix domain-containing protein [Erysipelotrichaceae bacterium]